MAESGAATPTIPRAQTDDNEDISWALSTAEAMWSRGDLIDAIKWVRRAAEAASDAEQDQRALDLAKAAAELQNQVGGMTSQPASQPPPPPPFAPLMAAAHSAVTAPPPNGSSVPPPAAERSPAPPAFGSGAGGSNPPRVSPSAPPAAVAGSFASGGRGPATTAGVTKRPSTIPRPTGTPAAPAVARVNHPRPLAPRASGAPPLPPAPTAPPPVPPVSPASSMPATARAIEVASPAAPESVPPPEASSKQSVSSPDLFRGRALDGTDPTATSHDLEPPEDTAQIDVPAAPPRYSSKAPSRGQLDTPSAEIDGSLVDAAHTTEFRAVRAPSTADEIDAWPTQAVSGLGSEDMTDNTANVTALIAALPPMRPREPSKHPMDPELLATQAVRVVVWRTPDGVRVAPAGTVVSAIACDAVLVALDPTADLSAWLTNKR